MRYQFQLDGRAAAPVRDQWETAAHDAVGAGYAAWSGGKKPSQIKLDASQGAEIVRVE